MSGLTAVVSTALGMTVLTAAPASAAQIRHKCEGSAVIRCANVEMPSPGVFNAHGRVTDNGTGYDVQVIEVRLEYNLNGVWTLLRTEFPADRWEPVQDTARTETYSCGSSARKSVRAKVYVQWRSGGNVSGDWVTTPTEPPTYICPR
ncbi:hypothetical protein [Streptomyces indicus]|uniref:Secreted protein n=1 Tax=Streptomyces indicus TaxID=417292 RepID=A0A1G8UY67_9ACTN|nr:hypothetical protein [Streptomyces indicus]SDJ58743.1 hypothetical protein SAMN05421806_1011136 [Streptomyces indicus]